MTHKPGPKTETDGDPVTRSAVTLDEMTRRKLRVIGDGNMSLGIRRAADAAFDRYQRGQGFSADRVMETSDAGDAAPDGPCGA